MVRIRGFLKNVLAVIVIFLTVVYSGPLTQLAVEQASVSINPKKMSTANYSFFGSNKDTSFSLDILVTLTVDLITGFVLLIAFVIVIYSQTKEKKNIEGFFEEEDKDLSFVKHEQF